MSPSIRLAIHFALLLLLGASTESLDGLPGFTRGKSTSDAFHNTPPSFASRRDWVVDEGHRVGDRVFVVRTVDPDNDPIRFSLAPALFRDGSAFFQVDPVTGEVFLRKSLKGRGGQDLYMYVRADDGHHQAKVEVSIRVIRAVHESAQKRKEELDATPSKPTIADMEQAGTLVNHVATGAGPPPALRPALDEAEDSAGRHEVAAEDLDNRITLVVVVAGAIALLLSLGGVAFLLRRRWLGLDKTAIAKETIKSKGSFFNGGSDKDQKDSSKDIALSRLPSQPSWAAVLEKREPVLKSAEFFSTLTDDKWEFPRNKLKFLQHLSQGCFGQVWKCEAFESSNFDDPKHKMISKARSTEDSSIIVAVKTLKDHNSEKGRQDLLNELGIMKLLDPHPNVVTLLGCCTDKDPLFVIMEYVSLGKLQTFLRDNRRPLSEKNPMEVPTSAPLTSTELTQFGYQVAKGMEYIASKGIVHRDLAARNILITETRQCKVADFGLARDVISSHEYERKTDGVLPVRWMPPEALYDNVHTTKSDVWAFGILLWEIVTLGSTPYPGMTAMEVTQRVRDGYRLEKPEHCKREMYNIMSYCWESNPTKRPCFTELTHMLEKLIVSENDYIELERFPEHAYYNVCHDLPGEKL